MWLSLVLLGSPRIACAMPMQTTSECMPKGLSGSPSILPRTAGSLPDSYSDVDFYNTGQTGNIVAGKLYMFPNYKFSPL